MPLKKEFITYISHEQGTNHIMQGQRGKTSFGQAAVDRSEGNAEARAFIGVSKGKARQGRVYSSLGLAGMNNSGGLGL